MKIIRIKLPVLIFFIVLISARASFTHATTFQDLTITPKEPSLGENVTIRFTLNNSNIQGETVGFIIEHHPPAYLVTKETNSSLRFSQIAKSVMLPENKVIPYKYVLSSNYTGVNVIVVTHEGSQVLAETFTVQEPDIADDTNIREPSNSKVLIYQVTGFMLFGVLIITTLILLLKRIRTKRKTVLFCV